VFVHSKKTGYRILKALQEEGYAARFHNADLNYRQRRQIEADFKDTENGIQVLVSTCTTAWGVNLPARNVVIVGIHRGPHEVDELDIIQMAGRAGRYRLDSEGHVYLVLPQGTKNNWESIFSQPRPVTSVLNQPQKLLSHVLAEIYTGHIRTLPDIRDWFYRSLAHRQGITPLSKNDADRVYTDLISMNMIQLDGEAISITTLGTISAEMYYPPDDVHAWYNNFRHLFASNLQDDDAMLAWAIACTPSAASDYLPAEMNAAAVGWSIKLSDCGIKSNDLYVLQMEAVRLSLTGGQGTVETVQRMRQFLSDHERILNAIQRIDRDYAEWHCAEYWRKLRVRLGRRSGKKERKPSGIGQKPSPSRALPPPSLITGASAARDTILLPCGVLVAGADLVSKKLLEILNESVMEIQARTGAKPISLIRFRNDDRPDGYAKVDDDFGAVAISLPKVWESAVEEASESKTEVPLNYILWFRLMLIPLIAIHICAASSSNSDYYKTIAKDDDHIGVVELSREIVTNLSLKADLNPPDLRQDPFLRKIIIKFKRNNEIPEWLKTINSYFQEINGDDKSPGKIKVISQSSFNDYFLKISNQWMRHFL
jgi:hypothetical protein